MLPREGNVGSHWLSLVLFGGVRLLVPGRGCDASRHGRRRYRMWSKGPSTDGDGLPDYVDRD